MKKNLFITVLVIAGLLFAGCGGSGKAIETETETEAASVAVETETETEKASETDIVYGDLPEGMMHSYLNGEIISEEDGKLKPFAIMINNIQDALPQSGISDADVIYEAMVEGGITRLMAVFQNPEGLKKIGSIRSARHYYIDFARDNDAIFVHFGQSKYAKARIENESIKTISGLSSYGGQVFYRSSDRQAPHNVYTTDEMLEKGVELSKNDRNHKDDYTGRLIFNETDVEPENGTDAYKVNIPFDCKPVFEYNPEDGLYYRSEFGSPHVDIENNKQVAVKNIIIQYVHEKTISDENHQDLTLSGQGAGYYISDGKAVKISWERKNDKSVTKYYDADGNQVKFNIGKIFYEYVPTDRAVSFGDAPVDMGTEETETETVSE